MESRSSPGWPRKRPVADRGRAPTADRLKRARRAVPKQGASAARIALPTLQSAGVCCDNNKMPNSEHAGSSVFLLLRRISMLVKAVNRRESPFKEKIRRASLSAVETFKERIGVPAPRGRNQGLDLRVLPQDLVVKLAGRATPGPSVRSRHRRTHVHPGRNRDPHQRPPSVGRHGGRHRAGVDHRRRRCEHPEMIILGSMFKKKRSLPSR